MMLAEGCKAPHFFFILSTIVPHSASLHSSEKGKTMTNTNSKEAWAKYLAARLDGKTASSNLGPGDAEKQKPKRKVKSAKKLIRKNTPKQKGAQKK